MKTIFSLGQKEQKAAGDALLLEWGEDFCCSAHFNKDTNAMSWLEYKEWNDSQDSEAWENHLAGFHWRDYETVRVCVALPSAMLTPFSMAGGSAQSLQTIYPDDAHKMHVDRINEWQIVNTWSLPAAKHQALAHSAAQVEWLHAYTTAIKIYNGFTGQDQINLHFTPRYFRVLVKKEGQLQLAQMYSYKHPLDVAYYLLKIAAAFALHQTEVQVILSGLIDESSALYKELHQYFTNLHFSRPPLASLPENDYPQHFFSSLFNLAACAL